MPSTNHHHLGTCPRPSLPVEANPFASDPLAGHLDSIHTELAGSARELSEITVQLGTFDTIAHLPRVRFSRCRMSVAACGLRRKGRALL